MSKKHPPTIHRYANEPGVRVLGNSTLQGPLCGQKNPRGTHWARGGKGYTDRPELVTCGQCLRAMSDAVTGYSKLTARQQLANLWLGAEEDLMAMSDAEVDIELRSLRKSMPASR